jgi:hypothetical protein
MVGDADQVLVISGRIKTERLMELAGETFGDMVKAVVDVRRRLLALGASFTPMRKRPCCSKAPRKRTCGEITFILIGRGLNG